MHLVKDKSRPTSVKTRIIADDKQVARLDKEKTNDIHKPKIIAVSKINAVGVCIDKNAKQQI